MHTKCIMESARKALAKRQAAFTEKARPSRLHARVACARLGLAWARLGPLGPAWACLGLLGPAWEGACTLGRALARLGGRLHRRFASALARLHAWVGACTLCKRACTLACLHALKRCHAGVFLGAHIHTVALTTVSNCDKFVCGCTLSVPALGQVTAGSPFKT